MDESRDAAAGQIDGQGDDTWMRDLAKRFLSASIEHCRWFSGHLLGEPGRERDAFAFRKLGDQLSRLEKRWSEGLQTSI